MPAKEFIERLDAEHAVAVAAAMNVIRLDGLRAARHLRGDIYEVRVGSRGRAFRLLFSPEGRSGRVLLAVSAFEKKSQQTPPAEIGLAEARLRDWRRRGR
ncbi:MAG: type II toxin-antitoxin system RelE/ParE family toxin [Acidimicrobiales bacterium]